MSDFVHLHLHTDYSMLDGAMHYSDTFERLKELGMNKVAITNHGNIINMPQMIMDGEKAGIQVIPGCELYVCWDYNAHEKDEDHKKTYHMIALAMNDKGYKNLLKLTTKGFTEGKYYRPRVDKRMLEEHSEGLIILTACLNGTLANQIAKQGKGFGELEDDVKWLLEIFGDRLYLEIQRHPDLPEQDVANCGVLELANKFSIPVVATCDSHYLSSEYFDAWQSLMLVQTQLRYGHDLKNDYYIKSEKEMAALFSDLPESITNTSLVANRCTPIKFDKSPKFPAIDLGGEDPNDYLVNLCEKGLQEKINKGKINKEKEQIYRDRYLYECSVYKEKGFSTYILCVADFVNWAKDNDIPVGVARGSGGGALSGYLTGITNIDPITYDLIFERFLNPFRESSPDFDIDFCQERRGEVVDYITRKYGQDKVCSIMTIGTLAASGALREICRRFEIPFNDTNEFAKLVPGPIRGRPVSLADAPKIEPLFAEALKKDLINIHGEKIPAMKIYEIAKKVEGLAKSTGVHAAGKIISNEIPLNEMIGLMTDKEGNIISSDEGKILEKLGFIKFDFLGLLTLTVIKNTVKYIKKNYNIDIDIDDLDYDDPKVFEIFRKRILSGIFQFDGSALVGDITEKIQPTKISHISDINAMCRPGPLDNGFDDLYIEGKRLAERGLPFESMMKVDNKEVQKCIDRILKPTYGVCLLQEQVMFIAMEVAGYTLGGSDLLRRAIGKKLPEEMKEQRKIFVAGCVKNKISERSANELFDQIDKFADYSFNAAHSMAYSIISYQTAWLKAYYPIEFMAANLTAVKNKQDKTIKFLNDARKEGIKILKPCINESDKDYSPTKEGIRFGLGAIKGISNSAIEAIVYERNRNGFFKSFSNFLARMRDDLSSIKKSDLSILVKVGAFDSIEKVLNKNQMLSSVEIMIDELKTDKENFLYFIPKKEEIVEEDLMDMEYDLLGYFVSKHPLENYTSRLEILDKIEELEDFPAFSQVKIGGIASAVSVKKTKTGKNICFINLEDTTGRIEIVLFDSTYKRFSNLIKKNGLLEIKGKLELDEKEIDGEIVRTPKMIGMSLSSLEPLEEIKQIYIKVRDRDNLNLIKEIGESKKGKVPIFIEYDNFILETSYKIPQTNEILDKLKESFLIKEVA